MKNRALFSWISSILAHPLTRNLDIDDPKTTHLREKILQEKGFLRKIYCEWYKTIVQVSPDIDGFILEIGSGAGFMEEFAPRLIKSELFHCSNIVLILNGLNMPISDNQLRAITMVNVFHHFYNPRAFLYEAERCLRPGGVIAMVEPWVTQWAQWVYTRFHHEPFNVDTLEWSFPESGPLSGANGALPWLIFQRDRLNFEKEFPTLTVESVKPIMPFRYLLSGGISLRSLMPEFTYPLWVKVENILQPWMDYLAMFALIVIRKRDR
jgi:SAM-dependent methyltransferase